jgi:hypothetical protein
VGQCLGVVDHPLVIQDVLNELVQDACLPVEVGLHYSPGFLWVTCQFDHSAYPAGHAVLPHSPYENFWRQTVVKASDMRLPRLPEPRQVFYMT